MHQCLKLVGVIDSSLYCSVIVMVCVCVVDVMISERCRIDDLRMLYKICFGVNGKVR